MSIQYKVYRYENDEWVLKQTTTGTSYDINIADNLSNYGTMQIWRVDSYDTETDLTTTGDIWSFRVQPLVIIDNPNNAANDYRYSDYEPDESWQFIDGEYQWTSNFDVSGGGRWSNNLVVFSIDENGLGRIHYG